MQAAEDRFSKPPHRKSFYVSGWIVANIKPQIHGTDVFGSLASSYLLLKGLVTTRRWALWERRRSVSSFILLVIFYTNEQKL
jgi:hypothetical protein